MTRAGVDTRAPASGTADPRRGASLARSIDRRGQLLSRIGPVVVLLVAAVARLWNLGFPKALVFDETYYVKDAWTLWHLGYESQWPPGYTADMFAASQVDRYLTVAEYVAHPPLGKWLIGLGEVLAGGATNSYGWRVATAVAGIAVVALVMVLAQRLFATPIVTVVAGGLMAVDDQAIVMSRVSLLDGFVTLFALIAVVCIVEDRFWAERRMGVWLLGRDDPRGLGPTLAWRPWLVAAGLSTGFCCAVKWSGVYFLAFFVIYVLLVDAMLRRRAGLRFWAAGTVLKQSWASALSLLPTFLLAYLVSWSGWFATTGGWDRDYLAQNPSQRATGFFSWVPTPIQDLWAWHSSIYAFHVGLDSPHAYNAPARLWLLIARPTSMYWDAALFGGKTGCAAGQCVSAITDIPNPLIWYAAVAASIYLVVRFVRRHEWQAGLLLMGIAAGYLPWLAYPNRTMFLFYSIAFEPYLLLCLAATIGLMIVRPADADSPDDVIAEETRRALRIRRVTVGVFLGLALLVSVFYYPLSTGIQTSYAFWHLHMWSPTWI